MSKVVLVNAEFYVVMEGDDVSEWNSPPFAAAYFEYSENSCLIAFNANGEMVGFFSPGWKCAVRIGTPRS